MAPTPAEVVVLTLRLPRALLALLVGACLGAAGGVTQGLFRNPLAEPSVLGISMGAATAAVAGFALGIDAAALWTTPLLAALGGAVTLLVLLGLAGGAARVATLLLAGIALSSLCAAAISLTLALQVERWEVGLKVMAWLMGSLEGRSWAHLSWATPPAILGLVGALAVRRDLDVLHLGPETAASLGVDLNRLRLVAIAAIAVLVGTATAFAGVIGFVGLIVPHMARLLFGPRHGTLLPVSMLLGGVGLLAVDAASRAFTQLLLPPGVITSLVGAPFFLWLLRRHERRGLT